MSSQIHATAMIEDGVVVGTGTAIWDNVHIRAPATIGSDCIIGEKTYIAYNVVIGDRVKINAFAYLCAGVTIETGVMVSAGVTFTNDRFPRATTPDLAELRPSEPDEDTETTTVRNGATIGSAAVIGPGLELGAFSMVGMGAVVTSSVGPFELVVGNPAKRIGFVCRCGSRLPEYRHPTCLRCSRSYLKVAGGLEEAPE